jgi:hypothetical protein
VEGYRKNSRRGDESKSVVMEVNGNGRHDSVEYKRTSIKQIEMLQRVVCTLM